MAVMTIKLKRGTATDFATENPVLAAGEPSWTTDTHVLKIGDGVTAYNSLAQVNADPNKVLTLTDNQTVDGIKAFKNLNVFYQENSYGPLCTRITGNIAVNPEYVSGSALVGAAVFGVAGNLELDASTKVYAPGVDPGTGETVKKAYSILHLGNLELGEGLSLSYNQTTGKWRLELASTSNSEEAAQ